MTEILTAAKFIGVGATIADSYKIGISNKFPLLICTRYKSVTSLNANLNLLSGNLIGVAGSGVGSKLQLNCNLLRIYGSHKSVIGTVSKRFYCSEENCKIKELERRIEKLELENEFIKKARGRRVSFLWFFMGLVWWVFVIDILVNY